MSSLKVIGYRYPPSQTLLKFPLAPIYELVILCRFPYSTLQQRLRSPSLQVILKQLYVLSHGFLLSMYKSFYANVDLYQRSVYGQWSTSLHNLLPLSKRNHKPFFVFLDVSICCMLDLVDPHGRHYKLPFRSRNHILDIIPHDQLVLFDHSIIPFLLGYFFVIRRIYINDVTKQCHITRVYLRPLTFIGSLVILFSLGHIMIPIFF